MLITIVFVLCKLLCAEMSQMARRLPELIQSLAEPAATLQERLLQLANRFPDGVGAALRESVLNLFQNGAGLTEKLYGWVFDLASALLRKLPDITLFLITALLSGFMISAQFPKLRQLWLKKIPVAWQTGMNTVGERLKTTFGGWCKAQLKLMGVTFLVLMAGFLLLSVEKPLFLSLLVSMLDALPVLGVGTVLIPWGLWMFVQNRTGIGVGLICLYGAAALLRAALEPRLLGRQIGLDPLLTLLAIYAGYRVLGVVGMVLFPVGAMLGKQYWNGIEKKEETEC